MAPITNIEHILTNWPEGEVRVAEVQPAEGRRGKPRQIIGFFTRMGQWYVVSLISIGNKGGVKEEIYVYTNPNTRILARDSQREGIWLKSEELSAIRENVKGINPFDLIAAVQMCIPHMNLLSDAVKSKPLYYKRLLLIAWDMR